jgi:hypothetical protein
LPRWVGGGVTPRVAASWPSPANHAGCSGIRLTRHLAENGIDRIRGGEQRRCAPEGFSTVAHGPVGHDRSMKMVAPTLQRHRPVDELGLFSDQCPCRVGAPPRHEKELRWRETPDGTVAIGRLAPGAVSPETRVATGYPTAPPTVAPGGEARTADALLLVPQAAVSLHFQSRLGRYRNRGGQRT